MEQVGVCDPLTDQSAERFRLTGVLDGQPDLVEPLGGVRGIGRFIEGHLHSPPLLNPARTVATSAYALSTSTPMDGSALARLPSGALPCPSQVSIDGTAMRR